MCVCVCVCVCVGNSGQINNNKICHKVNNDRLMTVMKRPSCRKGKVFKGGKRLKNRKLLARNAFIQGRSPSKGEQIILTSAD